MSFILYGGAVLAAAALFCLPGRAAASEQNAQTAHPPQAAQATPPPPPPPPPARPSPRPGPAPLPILPALPRYDDTSFYAENPAVPHGRVVQATYKNFAGKEKRLHVYLPPGYDADPATRYPVLYLNHGGGENDSHWTATPPGGGSAQHILDNLIAGGKAKPMIVVMPDTRDLASRLPPTPGKLDDCSREFLQDIIPFVDRTYRTKPTRENRALAGLSMGGFVVMNTGLAHLDTFSELYVYSSGYFPEQLAAVEESFKAVLTDPKTNEELLRVPLYMAEGETDIALKNGQATLAIFNRYGLRNFWVLSSGGHEWKNWRRYLWQTAQIMFPDSDR